MVPALTKTIGALTCTNEALTNKLFENPLTRQSGVGLSPAPEMMLLQFKKMGRSTNENNRCTNKALTYMKFSSGK